MKPVTFQHLSTSSLGFGCVKLTAHDTERAARRTLEVAFDEGIRHFDVARLYGFGQAEGILGRFIRDRRSQVTVTTKFGLYPPHLPFFNLRLFNLMRRVVAKTPSFKKRVAQSTAAPIKGIFSAQEAEKSLDKSLHELQTDYVDILLLHECSLDDANNPEMLQFLTSAVQKGKVRLFGLGTHYCNLPQDFQRIAAAHTVVQFENSPSQPTMHRFANREGRLLITHGIFNKNTALNPKLVESPVKSTLEYAQKTNPNGITLFSSTNIKHIRDNARIWRDLT